MEDERQGPQLGVPITPPGAPSWLDQPFWVCWQLSALPAAPQCSSPALSSCWALRWSVPGTPARRPLKCRLPTAWDAPANVAPSGALPRWLVPATPLLLAGPGAPPACAWMSCVHVPQHGSVSARPRPADCLLARGVSAPAPSQPRDGEHWLPQPLPAAGGNGRPAPSPSPSSCAVPALQTPPRPGGEPPPTCCAPPPAGH